MRALGTPKSCLPAIYRTFWNPSRLNALATDLHPEPWTGINISLNEMLSVGMKSQAIVLAKAFRVNLTTSVGRQMWRRLLSSVPSGIDFASACRFLVRSLNGRPDNSGPNLRMMERDEVVQGLPLALERCAGEDACHLVALAQSANSKDQDLVGASFAGIAKRADAHEILKALPGMGAYLFAQLGKIGRPESGGTELEEEGHPAAFAIARALFENDDDVFRWAQQCPLEGVARLFYYGRAAEKTRLMTLLQSLLTAGYVGLAFERQRQTTPPCSLFIWNVGLALGKEGLSLMTKEPPRTSILFEPEQDGDTRYLWERLELIGVANLVWSDVAIGPEAASIKACALRDFGSERFRQIYSKPSYGSRLALGLRASRIGLKGVFTSAARAEWCRTCLDRSRRSRAEREEKDGDTFVLDAGLRALEELLAELE
jgi:hypothetical protein